jgi:hypothetical protein
VTTISPDSAAAPTRKGSAQSRKSDDVLLVASRLRPRSERGDVTGDDCRGGVDVKEQLLSILHPVGEVVVAVAELVVDEVR